MTQGFAGSKWKRAGFVAGALCLFSTPVFADAIDGHWCSTDGKQLTIAGRAITTPGGAKIEGDYSRHAFSYVAPQAEADAGATIYMRLLNETTAQAAIGTPVAPPQTWKRCEHTT